MNNRSGPKGYEYNPEFMREAFELFCQGMGPTEIADRLSVEYPTLCRQTVSRIINKYDWEDQRTRFIQLRVDGATEKDRLAEKIDGLINRLETIIEGGSENHQHYAQWCRLSEMRAKILGIFGDEESMVLSTDQEMDAFLEAIEEDEVLGPVFRKRKKAINRLFKKKLEDRGVEKSGI